uniref:LamG-like jellyroll fold domain-containing protein n=1 Tax=uncultured Roseibium sp. TaxID=1936171 RepID=UPI002638B5D0
LSDISTTAKPAYGIVKSIADIDEAIKPIEMGTDRGEIAPPDDIPTKDDLPLPEGMAPVFAIAGDVNLDGTRDGQIAIEHSKDMEIAEGTIAFSFKADKVDGWDALFSKDASGYVTGGHLTAWVTDGGDIKVRFQDETGSLWLKAEDVFEVGKEHEFAFTFGDDGAVLYVDGVAVAEDDAFESDWLGNEEYLMIGANGWSSPSGEIGWTGNHFDGVISDFTVLDQQLDQEQISNNLFV